MFHVCTRKKDTAIILIDGEYYEVDYRTLDALQSGFTSDDFDLYPLEDDDDDGYGIPAERELRNWYHGRVL